MVNVMIVYNNIYRGPFEYEKFALNILSFHNIVNSIESIEMENTTEEIQTLTALKDEVDKVFEDFTGANGLCEKNFLLTLTERKCMKI